MLKLYDELFGGYKITKKYFRELKKGRSNKNEILQSDKWSAFRWDSDDFRITKNPVAA